jgi:hypothetical protein
MPRTSPALVETRPASQAQGSTVAQHCGCEYHLQAYKYSATYRRFKLALVWDPLHRSSGTTYANVVQTGSH